MFNRHFASIFTDTGCRNRNRSFSAYGMGWRHRAVLQPLGKDSNASPLPARLQAGPAEGPWHRRVRYGCLQWAAFASGNTADGNKQFSLEFSYQLFRFPINATSTKLSVKLKRETELDRLKSSFHEVDCPSIYFCPFPFNYSFVWLVHSLFLLTVTFDDSILASGDSPRGFIA